MKVIIEQIIEKLAIKAAKKQANTTCAWITYQPEETEAIKKLRKR